MKNSEIVHDLLQVNRELPIGPEINQDTLTRPSQNLSLDVGLQPFIQPQTVHVSGKMALVGNDDLLVIPTSIKSGLLFCTWLSVRIGTSDFIFTNNGNKFALDYYGAKKKPTVAVKPSPFPMDI
ncbi:hypothetical protein DERF_002341 [Dermatophagoides farinae]|uniref:Uncharacterized protein n=1 Tax=Dermatophagoides farinae TaxID=6954 RepID=A0A922IFI5_DERFA|nr:hypothetical protein DERF_002341 [Dermatophagoides farinae]